MTAFTQPMRALTLRLDDELFAIEAQSVREILDLVPVTVVPNASPFAAGLVNCLRELKVGLLGEMRLARVRAPQKAADEHTLSSEVCEYDAYLGARTTLPLVGITLPVGEVDRVAVAQRAKR